MSVFFFLTFCKEEIQVTISKWDATRNNESFPCVFLLRVFELCESPSVLQGFHLPSASSSHPIQWKQKMRSWNKGNVQAFFLFLLSCSPFFLFGPLITWTSAEGLRQHQAGEQVTRIIAQSRWHHSLELDFNLPVPGLITGTHAGEAQEWLPV